MAGINVAPKGVAPEDILAWVHTQVDAIHSACCRDHSDTRWAFLLATLGRLLPEPASSAPAKRRKRQRKGEAA